MAARFTTNPKLRMKVFQLAWSILSGGDDVEVPICPQPYPADSCFDEALATFENARPELLSTSMDVRPAWVATFQAWVEEHPYPLVEEVETMFHWKVKRMASGKFASKVTKINPGVLCPPGQGQDVVSRGMMALLMGVFGGDEATWTSLAEAWAKVMDEIDYSSRTASGGGGSGSHGAESGGHDDYDSGGSSECGTLWGEWVSDPEQDRGAIFDAMELCESDFESVALSCSEARISLEASGVEDSITCRRAWGSDGGCCPGNYATQTLFAVDSDSDSETNMKDVFVFDPFDS